MDQSQRTDLRLEMITKLEELISAWRTEAKKLDDQREQLTGARYYSSLTLAEQRKFDIYVELASIFRKHANDLEAVLPKDE